MYPFFYLKKCFDELSNNKEENIYLAKLHGY